MTAKDSRAIGIFDSGVGGLTVQKALSARLPWESTTYLGDTARLPYGTKSADVVVRYSLNNADFLVQQDVKLLVVACNTVSAVALPTLERHLSIPVVGVIEPGAAAAVKATRTGKVGVIGTPGTVRSGAYQRAISALDSKVQVEMKACPLFVPLAEEGWVHGDVPRLVAQTYLTALVRSGVDTLVLGCTHYPILKDVIREIVGDQVALVDSGEAAAERVAEVLASTRTSLPGGTGPVSRRYFVTDTADSFTRVAARFLGHEVGHAEQVDIAFRG